MNKVLLAEKLSDKMGFKKKIGIDIVENMLELMKESLSKGEKVQLIPFGTFEVRTRRGRTGRNPRTGEQVEIKERRVVAFKSGKGLKGVM
ncbi:MAG: HU family DNA-binding protein [Armatimonadota bacterium]